VLRVGHDPREHGRNGAVDRREYLAAAQHACRAALRNKDAVRRQLALHNPPVELLRVQLRRPSAQHICRTCLASLTACHL